MTFKEFKEIIEREDGFQVIKDGNCHKITNKEGNTLVLIGNFDNYAIDTLYSINETDIQFLDNNWHTISTYISTPIEDRQLHHKEVCLNVQEYNYIIERIQTKIQMECDIVYKAGGGKLLSDIYDDVEKLKIKEEN